MSPDRIEKQMEPIVEILHLRKAFGNHVVLKDFSLTLNKGENVVVIGKSGSGKSVLIKCIVRLLRYDSGIIKVFGTEIKNLSHEEMDHMRARIGFVFQNSALYDSMTVEENLEFALRRHRKNKSSREVKMLIDETLGDVGLSQSGRMMPAELSGGMKKRIGLARSLVLHPELMLYDEPTTGLDPITSAEIIHLMLETQRKYNTSSIIISHDLHCAQMTANKVCMLVDGINYATGTYEAISHSTDPKVHTFFQPEEVHG
jgi:phospholipid/cholesterol/gamma-HCH transport system ATP-binding protein